MSNVMKIRLLGAELFHAHRATNGETDRRADGRTDRHDEVNSRFRNFANAPKRGTEWVLAGLLTTFI